MPDSIHPYASFWLDVIDRAAKVAAVGVAGYWAIWNHVKKRTFKERLQPQVDVRELDAEGRLLLIELAVENVGNSLIELQDIRICSLSI